ncbi:hypothetical protein GCM10025770_04360 [Viridibacterium curvum]|uniref:Uncharacterized protein n=1 Tax=Viridibacterium curvum TaxID=1101404 RepID=A0ABP9QA87_9RHOO
MLAISSGVLMTTFMLRGSGWRKGAKVTRLRLGSNGGLEPRAASLLESWAALLWMYKFAQIHTPAVMGWPFCQLRLRNGTGHGRYMQPQAADQTCKYGVSKWQ